MFTGLIEAKGRIVRVRRRGRAGRVAVAAAFASDLARGESVAVDGVCLTVVGTGAGAFVADVAERTMAVTTLGRAAAGRVVNLERAARVGDRLGGHIVTGHVDAVARIVAVERTSGGTDVTVELPATLATQVVPRGSIALDGVSLTVADVDGRRVSVSLIPETLEVTTAGGYRVGAEVNVETDVLAKYRESHSATDEGAGSDELPEGRGLTLERLRELGFTE